MFFFAVQQLQFLGHELTPQGIKQCEDNIEAIMQASPPTNITSLRSLLGLLTYYVKFVPNFATIVEPLHVLLRKDVPF